MHNIINITYKDYTISSIGIKSQLENDLIFIHLLNVFSVILAFINTSGIDLLLIPKNILGQISDSIKIAIEGFQKFKNLFVKYVESIGKNWCVVFLKLYLVNIWEELKVDEVIKIFLTNLFFSNFSTIGIILKISPTLEPWNHISFPLFFFLKKKQNFSKNLLGCSFFFNNLAKIIIGEINAIKLINNL